VEDWRTEIEKPGNGMTRSAEAVHVTVIVVAVRFSDARAPTTEEPPVWVR
jgi:hypothetical protein